MDYQVNISREMNKVFPKLSHFYRTFLISTSNLLFFVAFCRIFFVKLSIFFGDIDKKMYKMSFSYDTGKFFFFLTE